ncbi:MAG: amidohydrolase [Acidobacteriaceae bacterium]
MPRRKAWLSRRTVLLMASFVFTAAICSAQEKDPPDAVLINGKILTVDSRDSIAEAIAIRHGKIVAVGSNADVKRLVADRTKVIDLHGRTVTPGLIDSHGHFANGGLNELYDVDLTQASQIAEVVEKVRAGVSKLKPGEWLQGDGWDEGKLQERRYIYAADLDGVSPNNPVWLTHTTGHYGVANSYAIKLAHLEAATASPSAGTIDKDSKGQPTGVLKESAMSLVTALIAPATPQEEYKAILHVVDELHQECITSVKDADIRRDTWDSYRKVLEDGKLDERIFVLWHAGTTLASAQQTLDVINSLPRPPNSLGDGRLFSGGAKLYMDGSGGARTAWVYQEWNKNGREKDAGNYGYPTIDPETYRQMVRLFHNAGVHVGTHAIGDRAIDWVVDTYAQVLSEKPTPALRHSIIHANIPTDHAIEVMARLEKDFDAGYPESQAPFLWWLGDTYAGNFGPERAARLNPFDTYVRKGIHWGGGSDYFVTPLAARYGLWASVARETRNKVYGATPFGTAESVDIHSALRSYTGWAARQLFLENRIGSIETGKDADIAVWDRDPYTIATADIKNLSCEMTLFNGKIVFQSSKTPITVRSELSEAKTSGNE